ncbi:ROK family protein [Microbacterium hydrocarbonoxydans]|uniref:ROK family protein n=1 Tax=Microbacterium hydrocarbonoxydans TaxID=273678 RepID=UPI00203FCA0C|nr:ROK family protein [Microbacterium hydrocarbonoxydans]MCM3778435.1 ROK family protein [Microbacterium hydrocarbonoxydans]
MSDDARDAAGMPEVSPYGVIEVGGSHATAATVEVTASSARVVESATRALDPALPADELLDTFVAPARRLGGTSSVRWVVAMPGPFDYERGVGIFGDVAKFDALRGVDVREGMAARLGLAPERISFVNDAAAYALGEWAFGADTRADRQVCVTLGTGVGSAFLDRGRIVTAGEGVPPDGWVYPLEFDGRPLEDTISTRAIVAENTRRTGRVCTVKEIASEAAKGQEDAAAVLDRAMHALGLALAPWLASFGADRLTVGGSMVRSWPVLVGALHDGLTQGGAPDRLEVVPSRLLDAAPLLGAAHWLRARDLPASS